MGMNGVDQMENQTLVVLTWPLDRVRVRKLSLGFSRKKEKKEDGQQVFLEAFLLGKRGVLVVIVVRKVVGGSGMVVWLWRSGSVQKETVSTSPKETLRFKFLYLSSWVFNKRMTLKMMGWGGFWRKEYL